jgi:hypothetical protein
VSPNQENLGAINTTNGPRAIEGPKKPLAPDYFSGMSALLMKTQFAHSASAQDFAKTGFRLAGICARLGSMPNYPENIQD